MNQINQLFDSLSAHYPTQNWWPADTSFEMMIGAILTQNTNWKNVERAIENFDGKLSPQFIQQIPHEELASIIRPSGYYNQKAIKLKAITSWFQKYSFDINMAKEVDGEKMREELLSIKGVGPETADSILVYSLDKHFFVIDTYTRRILRRFGMDIPTDYDELRILIEKAIPKNLITYQEYHALIVVHAKNYCSKIPKCEICPLTDPCKKRI